MKKTEQQTYRLSEKEKEALANVAEDLGIPAASLVGILANRFVKARDEHGNRLIWPPEFNYYPESALSVQEEQSRASKIAQANDAQKSKAG